MDNFSWDNQEKIKVAKFSIISNSILTVGKLTAGVMMGSISVLSEAIHSGLDLIAAIIAFASVRESNKPADDVHRYGHGKFENLAAITEAILILVAAGLIIKESLPKLLHGATEVRSLGVGAGIMGISALVNMYVSSRLMRVAKKTDSPALAADAWHLRTDVLTSLGVLLGIILIKLTGFYLIDPLIAIGVTILILKAAYDLVHESLASILDARLPDHEEDIIKEVLQAYNGSYVDYRRLRTRKAGPQRHIDFTLIVPRGEQIISAHSLCDSIEQDLRQKIPGVEVVIHAEPCLPKKGDCEICNVKLHYCMTGDRKVKCESCDESCASENIKKRN
ncbi:cation diffusion facilitator family transporter [Desulfotomaculum arcticum]|uniref:Cation diffusion facilitator family transporter n=1 Tax=Desulfotruncus arcticus DSM 17038 TaxID=1121424 RepID=A0A1I2SM25_9FIRM|nr:cation diffusion facilitator family transporter [Desulfotruncus arcticus]SFG50911.1 cation diffusion facilitator family transporter [Desulfotomaculum arcticum] [Desulfotruncus arcticus DSM 17038]